MPVFSCRHNLYIDIQRETGNIKYNFPGVEIDDMKNSCSLDEADSGEKTLEEVGAMLNITRERTRQIEVRGLLMLKYRKIGDFR